MVVCVGYLPESTAVGLSDHLSATERSTRVINLLGGPRQPFVCPECGVGAEAYRHYWHAFYSQLYLRSLTDK